MDASSFCLSCGSCSGLCHRTLTRNGRVHGNCRVAHTKLHVSKAAKGSKWSRYTNVPEACPMKSWRGTQSGNHVNGVMTPMWSNLEGALLPMSKQRPVLNMHQGHLVRTSRRGLRMFKQGCRCWQNISEPIVRYVVIRTPSALVHGLWALVSPGPIKLLIHISTYFSAVFVRMEQGGGRKKSFDTGWDIFFRG